MKYILPCLLLLLTFGNCRKKGMPKYEAFKVGKYHYDFNWDGVVYENYLTLSISQPNILKDYNQEELSFYYTTNYEIPNLSNDSLQFGIQHYDVGYLPQGDYHKFRGGLYKVSSGSFLSLSTDYYLRVPAPESGVSSIKNFKCYYYPQIDSTPTMITGRDIVIEYQGKVFNTYKLEIGWGSNCLNNETQILYLDNQYGLVRYEIYDKFSNRLRGTYTLRDYN